jgi:hypothetical protein
VLVAHLAARDDGIGWCDLTNRHRVVAALLDRFELAVTRRPPRGGHLQTIDQDGCSRAEGVVQHPRSPTLYVCRCGRYLITFACAPEYSHRLAYRTPEGSNQRPPVDSNCLILSPLEG